NGKCWLEKAREDFINSHPPGTPIPNKYIILTHSMGNMPPRLYIYSKDILGKDFYRNDIEKVVFIAPTFAGSDMAIVALMPKVILVLYDGWVKYHMYLEAYKAIMDPKFNFLFNPYAPYRTVKEIAFWAINGRMIWDNCLGFVGAKGEHGNILEGTGYGILNPGTRELIPDLMMINFFPGIMEAKLDDDRKEPDYSVVYGRGIPVFNLNDTARNQLITKIVREQQDIQKAINSVFGDPTAFYGGVMSNLGSEITTIWPGSNFYDLPTSQAKFYALVQSNPFTTFTDDGDCAVPASSAKGIYDGRKTRALRNARFWDKIYSGNFNNFLDKDFSRCFDYALIYYGILVMARIGKRLLRPC
ncbi:MAG: hypothetical protein NT030_07225, partial [Candidatus Saganbacteria bacterium]|nr:hypothetical protein [Candidatus Saganbacteria bacterium]